MKNWILTFWLFIPSAAFSQIQKAKIKVNGELISIPAPPTCVHLYDSLFIDEAEITNLAWLEYLYSIKQDSSVVFYLSQIPDTTVNYHPIYGQIFRHPTFRMNPVMGITHEQAQNYCKWRSVAVTRAFEQKYKSKHYKFIYDFRLPTMEAWKLAASAGENIKIFPLGIRETMRKIEKKRLKEEFKKQQIQVDSLDYLFKNNEVLQILMNVDEDYFSVNERKYYRVGTKYHINEVYDYPPNKFGIYNIIGNVAEMTTEKGIAKGGSYKDSIKSLSIMTNFSYEKPEKWLGFRCVCIVRYEKLD